MQYFMLAAMLKVYFIVKARPLYPCKYFLQNYRIYNLINSKNSISKSRALGINLSPSLYLSPIPPEADPPAAEKGEGTNVSPFFKGGIRGI